MIENNVENEIKDPALIRCQIESCRIELLQVCDRMKRIDPTCELWIFLDEVIKAIALVKEERYRTKEETDGRPI